MEFPSLLINPGTVLEDFHSLADVTLMVCRKFDTSVALSKVVPLHKIYNPQAGLLPAGEWLAWIIRSAFNSAE